MSKQTAAANAVDQVYKELDAVLDSMTEAELAQASSNEGWSGQDVLSHLVTIEERTRGQINAALTGGPWAPAEEINDYNERQVAARRGQSLKQLRADLTKQHQDTLGMLRGATEADFDKEFTHPRRGRITLAQLCEQTVNHLHTHTAEIAAVKAKS